MAAAPANTAPPTARSFAANPDFNGVWASRVHRYPDGPGGGAGANLLDVPWAPLSEGAPETRKAKSYEDQFAAFLKVVAADGDVFNTVLRNGAIHVPYTETGMKALKDLQARRAAAGKPDAYARCLPNNVAGVGSPVEIFQRADRIGLSTEQGVNRIIYLDGIDRSNNAPTYDGLSVGHWEGSSLVVVTTDFLGETVNGWPISSKARLVETFRLSPDRKTLSDRIVLEDPINLKEPMGRMVYFDRQPATFQMLFGSCVEDAKGAIDYDASFGAAGAQANPNAGK